MNLTDLFAEFLQVYSDPEDLLPALSQRMLDRVADASSEELTGALHCLWRLTRHITRETCWSQVIWERREGGMRLEEMSLREEIRDSLFDFAPRQAEAASEGDGEPKRRRPSAPTPLPATIDQYVLSYHPQGDPIGGALPRVESYEFEDGVKRYWYLYQDIEGPWSQDHFKALEVLTKALARRVGDSDEFWAVLGPIQDALDYDDPNGYEDKIEGGRYRLVCDRIKTNTADLYDYWLSLSAEDDEDDRRKTVERMIRYIRGATAAECEEFFHGLDFAPGRPFGELIEGDWPIADKLWQTITQKSDLSLWLLARAGFYYWHSSATHRGSSLALAALGAASERIEWMAWHGLPPFLPFWAAAREAANEQLWEFSAHCLNRALVDVALYAPALEEEEVSKAEEFRFDLRFVGELVLRLREDIAAGVIPLRKCVALAAEMSRASAFDEWTHLRRALDDLVRRLGVRFEPETATLRHSLGQELVRRLEKNSWDGLMAAEFAWDRRDGVSMASHFRNAVEYEWQKRIGDLLSRAGATYQQRLELGKILHWLLGRAKADAADGRALLEKELGTSNHLVQPRFLIRSIRMNDLMNTIRHAAGEPDRSQCEGLRRELLEGGMLRAWLEAVQVRAG
jgi:hypothetical protein